MSGIRWLSRAFVSNLRTLSADDHERAALAAAGVQDPTVQGYFAWRRSLVAMVVIATVLSTTLATVRELTESDETPSLFDNVTEKMQESAEEAMSDEEMTDEDSEEEETTADRVQAVRDRVAKSVATAAIKEKIAERVEDAEAETEVAKDQRNVFGKAADLIELAALYALSAASLLALLTWTKFRVSFRMLLAGFLLSFFVPMIVACCPWSWWEPVEESINFRDHPGKFLEGLMEDAVYAAGYLATLLPTVLSLIPGVQRACLRIKTFLPEAMLPGWYLVAAAPLYGLFLLVIFVGLNQVASDPVFLIGFFLFLAAPAMYVIRADVFTRPLVTDADFQQMRSVQRIIGGITAVAGLLLLYYISTNDVMGIRAVGLDAKSALLTPLDLMEFFLEFLARSLFMTVFGADLFLSMTLASWRQQQAFVGTPGEERYHRVMTGLAAATGK